MQKLDLQGNPIGVTGVHYLIEVLQSDKVTVFPLRLAIYLIRSQEQTLTELYLGDDDRLPKTLKRSNMVPLLRHSKVVLINTVLTLKSHSSFSRTDNLSVTGKGNCNCLP